ncbi:MAG: hypothetical protein OXU79_08585 [Gemmatimonadota bacterium]|nr:hypothetical protein [Gemmatimonadota bacterium]
MSTVTNEDRDWGSEQVAKLQWLSEQMDKRIEFMEKLYVSIDRKLWAVILLGIGAILVPILIR